MLVAHSLAGTHVATSLSYLTDRPSLVLPPPQRPAQWMRPLLRVWLRRGHESFLLIDQSVATGATDLNLFAPHMTLGTVGTQELRARHPRLSRMATGQPESSITVHLLSVRPARESVETADIGAWPQDLVHDLWMARPSAMRTRSSAPVKSAANRGVCALPHRQDTDAGPIVVVIGRRP